MQNRGPAEVLATWNEYVGREEAAFDRYLVPTILRPLAGDLLDAVGVQDGDSVIAWLAAPAP